MSAQRSTSSLKANQQQSQRPQHDRSVVDEATASYLNLSNPNLSENHLQVKPRSSLTTSNKDQTSSHRNLRQIQQTQKIQQKESFLLSSQQSNSKPEKTRSKKLRSSVY